MNLAAKRLRELPRRGASLLGPLLIVVWGAVVAVAQEQRPPPPKPVEDSYPRWNVNGVFSTDFSALIADNGSRATMPEEGVTGEYALGGTLHAAKELRVSVRACVGCHGFELQSAYGELDLSGGLSARAGRIAVPFGGLSQRTSPAQVESGSKPLPYIMGWMPREREFNLGIVPAPTVDNGAAVSGNAWVTDSIQLGFEAALVRGLKGGTVDLDFGLTRDFEDSNGEPAGAARATVTWGALTAGGSAMYGRYDPEGELAYAMLGADLQVHIGAWNVRLEGVWRETEFLESASDEDKSLRVAYVAQVDVELHPQWRAFALNDGLRVSGVFLGPAGPSPVPVFGGTDDLNSIVRTATGLVFSVRPGVLLKGSAEYWNFSDFDDTWVFHFSFVVSF